MHKLDPDKMIDGAQALLSTLTSGGKIGLRNLKQTQQKDAALVMLNDWLQGVRIMKNNIGGDNAAWIILETALQSFIAELTENMTS